MTRQPPGSDVDPMPPSTDPPLERVGQLASLGAAVLLAVIDQVALAVVALLPLIILLVRSQRRENARRRGAVDQLLAQAAELDPQSRAEALAAFNRRFDARLVPSVRRARRQLAAMPGRAAATSPQRRDPPPARLIAAVLICPVVGASAFVLAVAAGRDLSGPDLMAYALVSAMAAGMLAGVVALPGYSQRWRWAALAAIVGAGLHIALTAAAFPG